MSVIGSNALAGASGQAGAAAGYTVERSLKFNDDDSGYLSKTFSSAGNRTSWSWSAWVKRSALGTGRQVLFGASGALNDTDLLEWGFDGSDYIYATTMHTTFSTTEKFRDPSAWLHYFVRYNGSNVKFYINGAEVYSWNKTGNLGIGGAWEHNIGRAPASGDRYFDGMLSEVHYVDGQALAPSDFAEYDSDNNWNPKEYAGSYGPQGGTAISAANGAVPILNTSGDQGGTVTSGVRSDSNSANIVLALPLNGSNGGTTITDYHHTIKGSGSAKAVSIYTGSASGGAVTSTAVSRYYGSSFYAVRGATNNYSASDYIYRTGDSDLDLGTGSFCVEFWYYPTALQSNCGIFDNRHPSTSWPNDANGFALITTGNGSIFSYSGGNQIINHSSKLTAGQWHHIAYTRDGSTERLFVNGNFFGSTASSSRNYNRQRFYLGTTANNGEGSDGYYQDFRMYKGVAKYTANFTPPELGAGGVNSFYLKFADNSSNATLGTDSSGLSNNFAVNNISAANKTSSTGNSWYFDGSNDLCSVDDSSLALGTGDFTVEYFLKPDTGYNAQSTHYNGSGNYPNFETDGATKFRLMGNNTYGSTLSAGSWYHCAVVRENGACTMWVNGTRVAHNVSHTFNYTSTAHTMGARSGNTYTKGWLSNIHVIVGTAKYSPGSSTINIPLVPIPTHPNTKLLALHASTMVDGSGQNLTITNNGATVSNDLPSGGAAGAPLYSDSSIDSPTNYTSSSGNPGGNYCVMNPLLHVRAATLSEGNLKATGSNSYTENAYGTIAVSSGKWYAEATVTGGGGGSNIMLGVKDVDQTGTTDFGAVSRGYGYRNDAKRINSDLVTASYGATYTAGDVIGIALDLDAGTITFYKNGSSQGVAYTGISSSYSYHFCSFCRNASDSVLWNFGQTPFAISSVPTGHLTVCTQNLPEPTIKDGSTAMDVVTYSGDGTNSRAITGINHSPDLVWIKARNQSDGHNLFDIVRGTTKVIKSNNSNAEATGSNSLTAFNSDGFTVGNNSSNAQVNASGFTYVGWAWDAGSSTVSNTDGSITSQVRASQTNGFSIITYSGTGSNATVGHGLNAKPDFYVCKTYSTSDAWMGYHSSQGATKFFEFTSGAFSTGSNRWNDTEPTSSVISLGTEQGVNGSGRNHVAYLWTAIPGFSSFGSYQGNGSADGPFIYTGFAVRYLLQKRVDSSGSWAIKDAAREPYNVVDTRLYADAANADMTQSSFHEVDFLSNGFKVRSPGGSEDNASNGTFVYAAFASHPFKTARSR